MPRVPRRLHVQGDAAMVAHAIWVHVFVGQVSLEQIVQIGPVQVVALAMELASKVNVDVELAGLGTCAFFS